MSYTGIINLLLVALLNLEICFASLPLVINTWNFPNASQKAWEVVTDNSTGSDNALDALTLGCNICEHAGCGTSVGYGGSPDENGETTLDAMVYDGDTMDMGAVGGLRRVKDAIAVARKVLDYTEHSFIVGDLATEFAKVFNYTEKSLQTNYSSQLWENWKNGSCQPNFWKNVDPDSSAQCGPYTVSSSSAVLDNLSQNVEKAIGEDNHDTIGMIVISESGHVVAGTSTNGLTHKISGRVGDSPIAGAGAYADSSYGAAVATGNGDIMMRFLPSFLAVEQLRRGSSPTQAARLAISRIAEKYPSFSGALIVADREGEVGAACNGMSIFPFIVANNEYPEGDLRSVNCTIAGDSSNTLTSFSVTIYISVILSLVCYF